MVQVTLEQAEGHLAELIEQVQAGEEIVITDGDTTLARLVAPKRSPGLGRGSVLYIADDFDAPLEDFAEYM